MAIIPDIPTVNVDIVVDGSPLLEYLDEDDGKAVSSNSTTKYVECVSGSYFAMRTNIAGLYLKHLKGGNCVNVVYHLDGQRVDGVILRYPWEPHQVVYSHHAARYMEGGSWKEREFAFADLVTTEDAASSKPRPELKNLGTITIELYCARAGKTEYLEYDGSSEVNVEHGKIHEKHLKGQAISTQAKLGEARSIGRISTTQTDRIGDAFATFNFQYRSRKDLQTLGLIPRSPSPVPLEDRAEETLTREELLEVFRKQKARRGEQIAIKQELKRERMEDDESDDDPVVISSRPPAKKLKTSTNADTGIESIDLTDE